MTLMHSGTKFADMRYGELRVRISYSEGATDEWQHNYMMAYPMDDASYILDTDASNWGIRATLSQLQWRPVNGAVPQVTNHLRNQIINKGPAEVLPNVTGVPRNNFYQSICTLPALAKWIQTDRSLQTNSQNYSGKKETLPSWEGSTVPHTRSVSFNK